MVPGKTKLASLSTLELLQIKRSLGQTTSLIVTRLGERLTELVAARLGADAKVTIFWSDIAFFGNTEEVMASGVRMFEIGDEVEEEGVMITIDESNVDTLAQRVKLMIPFDIILQLENKDVPISDIIALIDEAVNDPERRNAPTVDDELPEMTDPVRSDPTKEWLYQVFDQSKVVH